MLDIRQVIDETRRTIVFLGTTNGTAEEPNLFATGFLLRIDGIHHLATAKHVIIDPFTGELNDRELVAFHNRKDGVIAARPVGKLRERDNLEWMFHENPAVEAHPRR